MSAATIVPGISFTPEELAERRTRLGASEIPAVAGLSPKRTPLDVWAEKRGIVPPFAGNEYTEWGLRLEGAILQKYVEVTGRSVTKPGTMVCADDPWMSCSPDGLDAGQIGVEVKRFGEHRVDDFGPAGTDQVPMEVAAQCAWSMIIARVDRWDVAVLLGQADFRIYHLEFDQGIADHLYAIGKQFWFEHVQAGVQPTIDGSTASHKYLQQVFKTHSQQLLAPTDEQVALARLLLQVKRDLRDREAEQSHLEAQLKLAIGDAAGLEGLCTWKAPRSGYVGWKGIAEELQRMLGLNPVMVAEVERVSGRPFTEYFRTLTDANTNAPTRRFLLTLKGE